MTVDWLARLREEARFATRMAKDVPQALSDPELTLEDADQLYRTVENCARSFDAIVAEMEQANTGSPYFHAAETVSQLWSDLSALATNKVRSLQGLPPIANAGRFG